MTTPWWEIVLRAAGVYLFLLFLIRLSGRRTIGQFTSFDLLVVMLLSEAVSNALTGGDESITAGLIAAFTLISMNAVIARLTASFTRLQIMMEGEPVLVGKDGRILHKVLLQQHVPPADVEQALREADCELKDMRCAFLEADGSISILRKDPEGG